MKRASVVLVSSLVLGLVAMPVLASGTEKGKTHEVTVEFVSYDATAKTVTFKTDKGEQTSAPVLDKAAIKEFEKVKPGEKVVLTCQDDKDGQHEGIAMVKLAKPMKKAA